MNQNRHRRIRWTKRLLRPLPRRATMHRYPVLHRFADLARRRPQLWSFRVSAMTPAFYAGSILALQPIYGLQIITAFFLAFALRANLPTLVALQFITNPLTLGIYLGTGWVGARILEWLGHPVAPPHLTQPGTYFGAASAAVVGGAACGLVLGATLDLTYRFLAYEARKHHWHIPHRPHPRDESASPGSSGGQQP